MAATGTTNGSPDKAGELARLAAEIKGHFGRAEESEWERLRCYRRAGDALAKAKRLCPHGSWEKWLEENFDLSDRQAQKFVRFAKAPPKALLAEEKKAWREASGATGKGKGKKADKAAEPKLPDDGSRELPLGVLPRAVADEVDATLIDLREALLGHPDLTADLGDVPGVAWAVVAAIRLARRVLCGGSPGGDEGPGGREEVALAP